MLSAVKKKKKEKKVSRKRKNKKNKDNTNRKRDSQKMEMLYEGGLLLYTAPYVKNKIK
jgi:hypothetical protein